MKRCHIIVRGLVQGVFYRAYAHENARMLELAGYARNLQDGSVEVVAEGDEGKIKELIGKLRQGPRGSRVNKLDIKWSDAKNEFKWFTIIKDDIKNTTATSFRV